MKKDIQLRYYLTMLYILPVFINSCNNTASPAAETLLLADPGETPVTVTHVTEGRMAEYFELNATSSFIQKNIISANAQIIEKRKYQIMKL